MSHVSVKRNSILKKTQNHDLSAAYDYVMVFPMDGEKGQPLRQTETCKNVIKTLEVAGLETFSYLSVQDDEVLVLIRAPVSLLNIECIAYLLNLLYI